VVPIILFAVGLDSVFIISDAEANQPSYLQDVEIRLAKAFEETGSSILISTSCEAIAFFIGMITAVPALKNLCFVAGMSIIFNYFLLLTVLIPVLAFDNKRIKSGRRDLICCFTKQDKIKPPRK